MKVGVPLQQVSDNCEKSGSRENWCLNMTEMSDGQSKNRDKHSWRSFDRQNKSKYSGAIFPEAALTATAKAEAAILPPSLRAAAWCICQWILHYVTVVTRHKETKITDFDRLIKTIWKEYFYICVIFFWRGDNLIMS